MLFVDNIYKILLMMNIVVIDYKLMFKGLVSVIWYESVKKSTMKEIIIFYSC